VTNGLEEQALKTLGRDPERRTEQDAKVLASYLQDITFFTELHFPMMQMAACRELQLQCADCGDLLFSEGDDSEGRLYLLLRGTLRVLVKVHGEGGGADDSGGGGGVDEERGMTEAGVAVSEVSEVSEEVERYTPLQAFSDSAHAMSVDGESTTSEALRVNRTVEVLQPPAETKHPQQVLVQGIPNAWNVKHVYESFCVFGPVLAVDMYKNQSGMGLQLGKDLGSEIQLSHETNVATVTFTKPAHAQQAIREKLVVELDSDTLMPVQAAGNGRRQTRKTKQQAQSMAGFWSKAKLHVASRKRGDVGGMLINLESSLHQKHMLGHDAMVAILTRQAFLDSVHSILTSVLAVLDKPPQQRSLKELTLVRNFMECTDFYRGFPASEMIQRSCSRCLKKVVVMPGEVIYGQGATADRTFIIIRGTVQLEQTGDAGRDQPNQHSSSRLPMSVNGVIDMPSAAQVQVEGIGVDGWDGTRKGVGRYENEASLQKIFAAYGEMLGITIHHRVREQQNTSWAVVTFANGSAVTRCLEAKVVMAGSNVLTVTRAELQNSSDDADNTQLCEEEHQRSQTLTAGAHFGDETNKRKTRTSYRHTAKAVSGAVLACLSKQDYWRVCSTDSMQAVINRFFKLAVHHSSDSVQSTQLVDFDGYRQLYLRLGKVIATQERFSAKELRNSMHQDWDEDLHKFGDPENNPETMTLSQFSESMFELVDSWCGGVESTELYSNLLQTILDESTQSIPHAEPPDNLEFKPASKVRCCYQQLMNQRAEFQKKEKVAKAKAYKEDVQREQFKKSDADAMKVMAAKGMFGLSHAAAGGGAPKVRDEKAAAAAMREKYYRDMFDSVDQDGSGALDREEVAQLAFNMLGRQLNDFELDAAMLEMDPDGDANVDFDEFKAWFKEKTEGEALLQQLFESADDDGSGLLEREEVRKVMLELGYDLSQDELDAAMAEMDADGSGGVDYDEFAKWWRKVTSNETMMLHKEPAEEEYYRNMFDQFDEDGSGELDAEEVRALMKALGRELSDYELTTAMGLMDEDGGGTVCWEEFLKWFGWLTDSDLSVRQIFEAIDGDGSGSLDADECRLAVMRLCKESDGVQLSEEEVESAVRLMDRDGNGDVDCDEFAEWWSVWQFRKRNAPDDPVVAYYRDCFDELAFRHASEQVARQYPFPTDDVVDVAEEVRTSARKALEGQVLQGQGRIGHDHLMQLCAALGRPLYPHEQTWAISAIDPHNNGTQ
jgi:calmodulin